MSYFNAAKELLEWSLLVGDTEDKWVEFSPLWPIDTARINDKRPAYVKTHVPDGWVKNMTGEDDCDVYFLVRIKQEANQKWHQWNNAPSVIKAALDVDHSADGNDSSQSGNETAGEAVIDSAHDNTGKGVETA